MGRVWTREELLRLGDICEKYGVIVVSDEIHADFVFEGSHQVVAGLKESYRKFVVTCTAPSKTFNLAGLQVSNILSLMMRCGGSSSRRSRRPATASLTPWGLWHVRRRTGMERSGTTR